MSVGGNIRKFRKERGLTQQQLAEKCNLSRSYLADLERDRYNPSLDTLNIIANNLGVKASVLLGEVEKNNSQKQSLDDFDLGSAKLNKIARYAKDLTESQQETVLNVIEALRRAKSNNDRNDDSDEI